MSDFNKKYRIINILLLIWNAPLNLIALLLFSKVKYISTRSIGNNLYNVNFIEFRFIESITIGTNIFVNYRYIGKAYTSELMLHEVKEYNVSKILSIFYLPRLIYRLITARYK